MAKTARKRKSKQEQVSEELKLRIICLFFIFLVIIAAMQLGVIGDHLNYVFMYVFGNLNGIIYLTCILLLGYIVIKADFPKFNGPKAVGLYLLFIGLTLFISATPSLTGIKVIQSYFNQVPLNRGGLLGAVLYGFLSALFDYMGAIIAAVFIVVTGIILLGSKFYFEHKKEIQKRAKNNFNKTKDSLKQHSNYFGNFFKKKQNKTTFFDDAIFEDDETPTTIFEEIAKEDVTLPQAFTFNDEHQEIEIVDKEPPIPSVDEELVQNDQSQIEEPVIEHTNKNYHLPPLSLLHNVVNKKQGENKNHAVESAERLTAVLNEFGVHASINNISIGPSITKYELKLETGTRVNKIMSLQDDIKLALAAKDIRIEAPIPGKPAVGVEIPNLVSSMVSFKEVFKNIPDKYKDNKLVVIHDEDIERTFIGKGLVKDYTLKELKGFKCRNKNFEDNLECRIPTLEEVLELVKASRVILNIELKTDEIHYEGIEKDVIDLVNKYELKNRVILSSFNHESIKISREIDSEFKTGLLYYQPIKDVVNYAKDFGANAIHPDIRLVSEALIKEAKENNIDVNIYTVNTPILMRKLISAGVSGVFTDYPDLLQEIINNG